MTEMWRFSDRNYKAAITTRSLKYWKTFEINERNSQQEIEIKKKIKNKTNKLITNIKVKFYNLEIQCLK